MASEKKEPFRFEYTRPWLDWYEIVRVEIKPDDYRLFRLEARCGTWWIVGMNPPPQCSNTYRWVETQIGQIGLSDIGRFIKWAETERGGSRITEITASSNEHNIIKTIWGIVNERGLYNGK